MTEEPPPIETSDRTVTLENGKVVEVPQGISGISWVFGAWRGICSHEFEAVNVLFYIRDLEFIRSAAFDPVPFEEDYLRPEVQAQIRDSREEARKPFLGPIALNPICTPEMLLEMAKKLKLDIEDKILERGAQIIEALIGLEPVGRTEYILRLALICNKQTPEEALRLLAGEKNLTKLLSFLDNMIIPDDLPFGKPREDFFRYVHEEAQKRSEADQRKLLFVLAKCPHTPHDIQMESCQDLIRQVREATRPILDLLELEKGTLPDDVRKILIESLD